MKFEIEEIYEAEEMGMFEFSVAIGGWTYLVIYGNHVNGGFCCVPNHKWGCEMSKPNEVAYNSEKLVDCGASIETANEIAKAIQLMSKYEKIKVMREQGNCHNDEAISIAPTKPSIEIKNSKELER